MCTWELDRVSECMSKDKTKQHRETTTANPKQNVKFTFDGRLGTFHLYQ